MFRRPEFAAKSYAEMEPQAVGHLDVFSREDLIQVDLREKRLLRSKVVNDSGREKNLTSCINWTAVVGLGLAGVVSISVWTGITLAIARVLK